MKQLLKWAALVFVAAYVAGCGGGGGSPGVVSGSAVLATDAPQNLLQLVETVREFNIQGGKAPYTATSNNELVAVTGVQGSTLLIGTVGIGTADITVRDAVGSTVHVPLTSAVAHPFVTSAPSSITLQVGSTQSFSVSGGVPGYEAASSSSGVVLAQMVGSVLQLTGVGPGSATVTILDGVGESKSISVTVPAPTPAVPIDLFTTAPPSLTMGVGSPQTFLVGGGSGSYFVASDNTLVATASVDASGNMTINGVSLGKANIQITDTTHSKILTVGVTVVSGLTNLATTAPADVSIAASTSQTYTISGGTGSYKVLNTNPFNVGASVAGNQLTLTGLLVGSSTVTVMDTAGSQVVLSVNVIAPGNTLSLLPPTLTVSESPAASFEVDLQVYGGTGTTFHAFTSDSSIAVVPTTFTGSTLKVTVTNGTNACVAADKTVTLTVMDSQGATATSTLIIKNVNTTCP